MDKPLRCLPLEGQRDQKSPLRRCFKPRPPLSAEYAGFASGCRSRVLRKLGRFLRRLSGLLSGCPPTDTRPQARAKLGVEKAKRSGSESQAFCLYWLQNHLRTRSLLTFRQCVASRWVQRRGLKKRRGISAAPKSPCDLRVR